MNVQRTTKRSPSAEKVTDRNAKRRYRYQHMPAAEKETLLFQRRAKERELTSHRLLQDVARARLTKGSSPQLFNSVSPLHFSNVIEKGSTSSISPEEHTLASMSTMQPITSTQIFGTVGSIALSTMPSLLGGTTVAHSSGIFEKGSSSSISKKRCTPPSVSTLINGPVRGRGIMANIGQRRSDYVPLKVVPDCKFCSAKKFQYESIGFCCATGTVKLRSHRMPGDFKNTHVFIPRIPLVSSHDEKLPIQFKRTQFPVKLCFAMTINKAQGQTLDFVGIYLREPVFSHGQLYVALSRAKTSSCVKVLIRPPTPSSRDDCSTSNVVYEEIIQKAIM